MEQLLGNATDRSDLKPIGGCHAKRPSDFTILEKELRSLTPLSINELPGKTCPPSELRNMNADANRLTVLIQDTSLQIQMVRTV